MPASGVSIKLEKRNGQTNAWLLVDEKEINTNGRIESPNQLYLRLDGLTNRFGTDDWIEPGLAPFPIGMNARYGATGN